MRRTGCTLVAGCFLWLTLAGASLAGEKEGKVELKVGDRAPVFEARDDRGKLWKSSEHVGKKIVVIFFFPAAMTGG